MMRAAHLILDGDPKIFQDPLALSLSGVENETALQERLRAIETEMARRSTPEVAQALARNTRANVAMRQRYTEDELGKALARGVEQYVILGAGLDLCLPPTRPRRGLARLRGGPPRHPTVETRPLAGLTPHSAQQPHVRARGF
jgi:hypothetical protein